MKSAEIYRKSGGEVIITCKNLSWQEFNKCIEIFIENNYYKMFFEFDKDGNCKSTFQKHPINQTLSN